MKLKRTALALVVAFALVQGPLAIAQTAADGSQKTTEPAKEPKKQGKSTKAKKSSKNTAKKTKSSNSKEKSGAK